MKTSMLLVHSLFAFSLLAGGCSSMRFSTTLKPQPDPGPIFGEARFCINTVKVQDVGGSSWHLMDTSRPTTAPSFDGADVQALRTTAQRRFPSVFSEDALAIPVAVDILRKNGSTPDFLLFLFPGLIGVLPVYQGRSSDYEVRLSTPAGDGGSDPVTFIRRDAQWGTIYPLGLLPVVGHSDIPRRTWIGNERPKDVAQDGKNLTFDSLGEAVLQQIRSIPKAEAERVFRERCTWLQTAKINGRTLWLWRSVVDGSLHVWVFTAPPIYSNWNPVDDLVFPVNPDGTYSPMLMRKPPYFTEVSVRNENGSIVMGARSVTPSIRQLLALADPDAGGAAVLDDDALVAAMTRALIAAKNTEVPQLAVQAPVAERVAVLNAVEQRLVEAQQHTVAMTERAEDAVRQGQDAAGLRQKVVRIQAYMSVLAEIKNLLIQS